MIQQSEHIFSHSPGQTRFVREGRALSPQESSRFYRKICLNEPLTAQEDWIVLNADRSLKALNKASPLKIIKALIDPYDGSVKFIFETAADHFEIETVLIPEARRNTVCLSSQVGCQRGCSFCFTGKMGLSRNLTTEEILAQLFEVNRWITRNPEWATSSIKQSRVRKDFGIDNIVFMGLGEPLDNLDNLFKALETLKNPFGFGIAPRKICVSTVGNLDGWQAFINKFPEIPVALSLHAPNDSLRKKLMPIARTYSLEQTIGFVRDHQLKPLVQYILLGGVNDLPEHAVQLSNLLKDLDIKVNLIPYNFVPGLRFKSPTPQDMATFKNILFKNGTRALVRFSKGQSVGGACGQLARVPSTI